MNESLPPLIGGRYRPLRLLGRGGMGTVYEVEHSHTGEHFALKVLDHRTLAGELALERFRREARVWARIRSEHVVRVIDADVAPQLGGAPYLVMELLEGDSLGRLCGDTPQPPERVIDWLRQTARALDKAHALGIVHRDLKPENLFLCRRDDGTSMILKVLDFGIAKVALDGGASTASGEILGTPLFMAPEQADLQAGQITPQADLFALGIIAHKLLTGRHYWQHRQFVLLVREICLQPMPPPSERRSSLGTAFDGWFAQACHRDPARRFKSAEEQVEALAVALGDSRRTERSAEASASSIISWSGSRNRRKGARPVLVAGLVATAGVTALAMLRPLAPRTATRTETPLSWATVARGSDAASPSAEIALDAAASPATPPTALAVTPAIPSTPPHVSVPASSRPVLVPPPSSARAPAPRDPWADPK
jgi:serine/threonine-protein kinase